MFSQIIYYYLLFNRASKKNKLTLKGQVSTRQYTSQYILSAQNGPLVCEATLHLTSLRRERVSVP